MDSSQQFESIVVNAILSHTFHSAGGSQCQLLHTFMVQGTLSTQGSLQLISMKDYSPPGEDPLIKGIGAGSRHCPTDGQAVVGWLRIPDHRLVYVQGDLRRKRQS
jgi:hypothetical protein